MCAEPAASTKFEIIYCFSSSFCPLCCSKAPLMGYWWKTGCTPNFLWQCHEEKQTRNGWKWRFIHHVQRSRGGRRVFVSRQGSQHLSCQMSICSSLNRLFPTCWSWTKRHYKAGVCADKEMRQADRWMRNSSGRTDILSTLLQEMQKPVTKNLMKWKSSVLPVRFVAFSPCTVKVPRSLFSTGCSQQLTERETSQGEPAPLQCSESLPTGLLRSRAALPVRSFPQCKVYTAFHLGRYVLCCKRQERWPFKCSPRGL